MLFFNDAAAWSSFGLILAVLIAFIVHYYWKKNKAFTEKRPVPTPDGSESLKFREVLEDREKIKEELEKERQEHRELKIENAVLQEREKSLSSQNQALTSELNQLRERAESLQSQNSELERERAELTQQVVTRDDQLKDRGDKILENKKKIQNLNDYINGLEENLKTLEIDHERLSTEKLNLSSSEERLKGELEKLQGNLQNLQEERTQLLKEVTGLTHEKQKYLEEVEKIEKRCQKASDFYETLRDNGIEVDIEALLHYKEFHMKHKKFIEAEERKKEKERGSIAKGREYELSWKDDLREHFTEKEWEFIDIDSQPIVGDGKKGDYRVSFRDSENSATSTNQLHIYVEHKYTQEANNTLGEPDSVKHNQMNDDLKKAFESVSKGGEYDFIFLITNREIGQDRFRERGFFWINSDKDYQSFGLTPPVRTKNRNQQVKPAIIIMTRAKSFEFLWNFYTLWKNWSSHNVTLEPDMLLKNINKVFSSEEFKKNLIKWIDESDQFNLEMGEKMEKQWHELMDRLRIISKFWSSKKKQAYSLNREAIKLRNNAEWSTVDEEESAISPQLTVVTKKEEKEILMSSHAVKDNSVSEINSRINIEQSEVRNNILSNT